jgi:hypothetical protein
MADDADLANEQAQRWLQARLAATTQRKTGTLAPTGFCHYCGDEFLAANPDAAKKLFCDASCASDYAALQRRLGKG